MREYWYLELLIGAASAALLIWWLWVGLFG